jgi:peptide-methionine (S)-S-oxide reductase
LKGLKIAALAAIFCFGCPLTTHGAGEKAVMEKATFAAGCFWGVEKVFASTKGVGYTGGTTKNATYEQVLTGRTGHAEAIEVTFDPTRTSYGELVETFFRHHNPTTLNRQGNDIGTQYRSAIFYHSPEQKKHAEAALKALDEAKLFRDGIVTEVTPASEFWAAEEYHQKYLKKNPNGYCALQVQPAKVSEVLKALRAKA